MSPSRVLRWLGVFAFVAFPLACIGTTGGGIFQFPAYASGPRDAVLGEPLTFDNTLGYRIELRKATIVIGAVYLSRVQPISSVRETSCVVPGTYVAEVTTGVKVDALNPNPQPFGAPGDGVVDHALTGEVWLTGGRIDELNDPTMIVEARGTATRNGMAFPFEASVTIGANRAIAPPNAALPGANPICQQRIVTPIPVDFVTTSGGSLRLRVDPRTWFRLVDFSQLTLEPNTSLYRFEDANVGQPSLNLFQNGIRLRIGYNFEWDTGAESSAL